MDVKFGMLQQIKTQDIKNNPKLQNLQTEIKTQTDIFTQAKQDYDKASVNDGQQAGGAQPQTFATPTMSVDELQDKMNEAQEKLEKLQATLAQETKGNEKPDGQENKDEKNKIKPGNFSGMMA